jgi:hypothetical protein
MQNLPLDLHIQLSEEAGLGAALAWLSHELRRVQTVTNVPWLTNPGETGGD